MSVQQYIVNVQRTVVGYSVLTINFSVKGYGASDTARLFDVWAVLTLNLAVYMV